jgi:uncharacterized membrane protein
VQNNEKKIAFNVAANYFAKRRAAANEKEKLLTLVTCQLMMFIKILYNFFSVCLPACLIHRKRLEYIRVNVFTSWSKSVYCKVANGFSLLQQIKNPVLNLWFQLKYNFESNNDLGIKL